MKTGGYKKNKVVKYNYNLIKNPIKIFGSNDARMIRYKKRMIVLCSGTI